MSTYIRFHIISKCFQDASKTVGKQTQPMFFLEEDGWNDHGYHTMYHLHYAGAETEGIPEYFGPIRIMKFGQKEYESNLLRLEFPNLYFSNLPDTFVSLSLSKELYSNVCKILRTKERRLQFIKSLNLLLSSQDNRYEQLENDDCFSKSLLRDTTIDNYVLTYARKCLLSEYTNYDLLKQSITFKFKDYKNNITLKFDYSEGRHNSSMLPSRIVAFIGENGSGKSTLLYRIARLLYASPDQRRLDETVVSILPNDIGFSKLIMVSYSAFDNFALPGISSTDYKLIGEGLNNPNSRFVFCGLRDINKEYSTRLNEISKDATEEHHIVVNERYITHYIKDPATLADEFVRTMDIIYRNNEKRKKWESFHQHLTALGLWDIPLFLQTLDPFEEVDTRHSDFNALSTGWKFVLHSISAIISNIESNTLFLFDEPENHLHPPLLSTYLTIIRNLLNDHDSAMLIATHSPVVIRELYSSNVFIVHRNKDEKVIFKPSLQTFGATFSEIQADVFSLNSDLVEFYDIIDEIINSMPNDNLKKPEIAINQIEKTLGVELSLQLRGYVIARIMTM